MTEKKGTTTADRETVSSRVFEAPRELVFSAFTNPEHLAHWWGPKDFRNTFAEFDLRPGGHWRFVMHGPDGKDYPNHSVFKEITPPERIVFDHVNNPNFQMTIKFEAAGAGRTRFSFNMLFPSVELCQAIKAYAPQGNEQNFDRLGDYLKRLK